MPRRPALGRLLVLLVALPLAGVLAWSSAPPRALAGETVSQPRGAALVAALKTRRLKRVEFKDLALKDLVTWVRTATGWNVLAHHAALGKAGIDVAALSFSADFEDLSVGTLLETLLEPVGMAVRVHDNLIFLTSKADAQGKLVTRVYGISHITWTKIDFIAPDIQLLPSNAVTEEYEPEVVVEDDPLANGDAVAELIKELVEPEGWSNADWSIRATNAYMVVRAPLTVHARIPRALDVIASLK